MPPVHWETRYWRPPAARAGFASHAAIARQTGDYRSAITADIADWAAPIGTELAADLDDATRSLAAFDDHAAMRLGADDDQALAPMAAILLRTESASSSQIEHLTTSARQIALAEIDEGDRSNALEVAGNVRAMEAALRLAERLDVAAILDMHRELMVAQRSMSEHAGRFREELVWIGGKDSIGPRGADYVAPQHELVPGAVEDLVRFIAREDVPPLVQAAIAHAQFETIHPFADGNGRIGRALVHAMLRAKGVTRRQTVPISAGLLVDVDAYFAALCAYRDGDAEPIVRRFAAAARYAATTGRGLVDGLADALEASRERMAGLRADAAAWRLLPRLIGQPVVNSRYVKRALGINDTAAQRAIDALVERGVLTERTGRSRNRVYQHLAVLDELDAYAEQLRRGVPGGRH